MSEAGVSTISEPTTPERVFKVVFVGDSGVGKSSFIHRFCHDAWKPSFTATIGNTFCLKQFIYLFIYLIIYLFIYLFCHTTNILKTVTEKIERMDLTMARRPKGNYEAYIN